MSLLRLLCHGAHEFADILFLRSNYFELQKIASVLWLLPISLDKQGQAQFLSKQIARYLVG